MALTPDERAVLAALADAWNRFIDLPLAHPDDRDEFRAAIHAAQNIVAYRVARRVDPDVWS
jgi:hypothetical protein